MNRYPEKETPVDHEIHDLLKKRWSSFAFSSEPIEKEKINSLFEAARWAPSSFNDQPWKIIYATRDNPEDFDKMTSLLMKGNEWAADAYMMVLVCAVQEFAYNGKPNRHAEFDAGAAAENIFLQATSMGLVVHEMAGYDREKSQEILGVPKEVSSVAMLVIGYPGDSSTLSEDLMKRENAPRERKKISEFVFEGKWQS